MGLRLKWSNARPAFEKREYLAKTIMRRLAKFVFNYIRFDFEFHFQISCFWTSQDKCYIGRIRVTPFCRRVRVNFSKQPSELEIARYRLQKSFSCIFFDCFLSKLSISNINTIENVYIISKAGRIRNADQLMMARKLLNLTIWGNAYLSLSPCIFFPSSLNFSKTRISLPNTSNEIYHCWLRFNWRSPKLQAWLQFLTWSISKWYAEWFDIPQI